MNIKLNYLSNRIKAGLGAFILVGNIFPCNNVSANYNKSETTNKSMYSEIYSGAAAQVGFVVSRKDLNYSDEERKFLEDLTTGNNVLLEISDKYSYDYLEDVAVTIVDSNDNVIDNYVSTSSSYVLKNIDYNETYRIILNHMSDEYGKRKNVSFDLSIDVNSYANYDISDIDYYKYFSSKITLEKVRDCELEINGEMMPGCVCVGAYEIGNGYIDGVNFSLLNEKGKEVDNWISTKKYHNVYNLSDGNYIVRVNDVPCGYELDYVNGRSSDDSTLSSNAYDITIKNGEYMDNYCGVVGPTFYFSKSKENSLDSSVKKLKK